MGSDEGKSKRLPRGGGWHVRGFARSVYVRLVTDSKFAMRAFAIVVVGFSVCSFAVRQAYSSIERLSGVRVGPPTQQCGASKYGFLRANSCHPFSLPQHMKHVDVHPKTCGKLTHTTAGFCLCDDDEFETTIAAPKGCGTEPVMCERACASRPIVGKKTPQCSPEEQKVQKQCEDRRATVKPSRAMLSLYDDLAKALGDPLGVKMPPGSRRDLYTDFAMYGRRMSDEAVRETRRRVGEFKKNAPA
jgi:hypothetical protein